MIPTIGIVGGIGSGKSAVADAMQTLGGYLIAADRLGHDALRRADVKAALVFYWGDSILNATGDVDRKKVARIVFENVDDLRFLESQVFPHIEARIHEDIAQARTNPDVKFIILDAAVMLEAGWDKHCDRIVFVDAPEDQRLARLKKNRGWSQEDVRKREQMQMALEEKRKRADAVIVNDGEVEKILPQVKDALERWKVIC